MWQKHRYNELMFLIDTCQAGSMLRTFYSPNIVGSGSSSVSEDSLSVSHGTCGKLFLVGKVTLIGRKSDSSKIEYIPLVRDLN